MNSDKYQRLIRKLRLELGEVVQAALDDPDVIEIMLNPNGEIWIERFGQEMLVAGTMTAANAEALMGTVADALHTTVSRQNPVLEGELPLGGSRFEALLPPVVAAPTFTLRKKASRVFSLTDYVTQQVITPDQQQILLKAITERKNILVVGGTGSGKTTFTNGIIR